MHSPFFFKTLFANFAFPSRLADTERWKLYQSALVSVRTHVMRLEQVPVSCDHSSLRKHGDSYRHSVFEERLNGSQAQPSMDEFEQAWNVRVRFNGSRIPAWGGRVFKTQARAQDLLCDTYLEQSSVWSSFTKPSTILGGERTKSTLVTEHTFPDLRKELNNILPEWARHSQSSSKSGDGPDGFGLILPATESKTYRKLPSHSTGRIRPGTCPELTRPRQAKRPPLMLASSETSASRRKNHKSPTEILNLKVDHFRQNPRERAELIVKYNQERAQTSPIQNRQEPLQCLKLEDQEQITIRRKEKAVRYKKVREMKEHILMAEMARKLEVIAQRQEKHEAKSHSVHHAWLMLIALTGTRLAKLEGALKAERNLASLSLAATTVVRWQRRRGEQKRGELFRVSVMRIRAFAIRHATSVKLKKKKRSAAILVDFLQVFKNHDFMKIMRQVYLDQTT